MATENCERQEVNTPSKAQKTSWKKVQKEYQCGRWAITEQINMPSGHEIAIKTMHNCNCS